MMAFEEPAYLPCAWGLVALVLGFLLSRRVADRATRLPGTYPLGKRELTGARRFYNTFRFGLLLLAFAALVLALANPQRPQAQGGAVLTQGPVELVFALDVSTSMLTADVLPDRLTLAKKFITETTRGLSGEEVGVIIFAGSAQLALPLTSDYDAVRAACLPLSPDLIPRQGTSLARALAHAALLFKTTRRTRIICLLSDGESHTRGHGEIADSLTKAGVMLFPVGVGTVRGDHILVTNKETGNSQIKKDQQNRPIVSRLEEESLKRIVRGYPARYINLQNTPIGSALLLRTIHDLSLSNNSHGEEETGYFQWLLLLVFGLLLAEFLLPPGRVALTDWPPLL